MSGLFLKIVNMSIAASWLILAVLVLRLVLKKAPKWVNVLLWGIAAARLVLPFSIESAWSLIPSAETIGPGIMMDASPTIHTGIPALNNAVNPVLSESFAPASVASANPLLWLAYVLLCRDIELACDEKVVKGLDNERRADYTQALLACSVSRRAVAACPLAFGEVGVKERVKSVMNYKKPAFWVVVLAVVACAAVAVCFLTNPKSDAPDVLPLLYSHSYDVAEVSYESSTLATDFSMVAGQNTPVYAITDGMQLMSRGEHAAGDEWTKLGVLTETELTKENFDELFFRRGRWPSGESASVIRKNNANAWMLVYHQDVLYYVLQQKNGEVYLAYGYYDDSEKNDPYSDDTSIRWLYKLIFDEDTGAAPTLSLDDVMILSQKGHDLRWADFENFAHVDIGSGLHIWRFEIDGLFTLMIGGGSTAPETEPMYIRLSANDGTEAYIDIRDGEAAGFVELHKAAAPVPRGTEADEKH